NDTGGGSGDAKVNGGSNGVSTAGGAGRSQESIDAAPPFAALNQSMSAAGVAAPGEVIAASAAECLAAKAASSRSKYSSSADDSGAGAGGAAVAAAGGQGTAAGAGHGAAAGAAPCEGDAPCRFASSSFTRVITSCGSNGLASTPSQPASATRA